MNGVMEEVPSMYHEECHILQQDGCFDKNDGGVIDDGFDARKLESPSVSDQ